MGNCCAKLFGNENVYNNSNDQQSSLELMKESNQREVSMADEEENETILIDLFQLQDIDNLEQKFLQEINNIDKDQFEKIDANLKNLDIQQANFYVKFIQQEDTSYYDNIILQEVDFQYSVEQVLLFLLHFNGNLSKHTDINDDLIEYYDEKDEILRKVTYYKSKKVLMIQPKYLLDIEVLKSKDDGYICIQTSCKGTKLENNHKVQKMLKDMDQENLMETKVGGYILQKKEDGCRLIIYKNVNSKSSIGFRLAKGTLKSNFNYYLQTIDKELKQFVQNDNTNLQHYMMKKS